MIALLLLAAATIPQFTLPDDVRPRRHTIELTIDPARETLTGVARIRVTLLAPQSVLWVNGRDLTVGEAWVESGGKRIAATSQPAGGEFIGLTTGSPVQAGDATIVIRYSAPLSAEAVAGPNRKKVGDDWYVFTTFTPTDARRAFPCFDEPRFKTPWEISIMTPRDNRAFANAPMRSEKDAPGGMKLVTFAPTQAIAAEVVAFAVGPFDVWDAGTAGAKKTPLRVIAARGQAALGKEAGLATQAVLPRLEKYTGIPYPWEKLDHIALPQGAFGAVENPGLITYQSRGLLVPPAQPAAVRSLQAHEIGHQWFGNLVTQSTWTDVWLSEGFATWIAAKMMDEEQPADRKHIDMVVSREAIMATDSGSTTHPVRREMHNRAELDTVYDRIPYQKGGAILLMLENWLGEDWFQQGLRKYLADHRMGNATTHDLEEALHASAEDDPTAVMESFLNTTGVPAVKTSLECSDGVAKLILERGAAGNEKRVPVPVCWKTAGAAQRCAVFEQDKYEVSWAADGGCPAWLYPNANGAGYYRVQWTPEQLNALPLDRLNGAERLTLVYDLRAEKSTDAILNALTSDAQPEVAHAARVALGLEQDAPPRRRND